VFTIFSIRFLPSTFKVHTISLKPRPFCLISFTLWLFQLMICKIFVPYTLIHFPYFILVLFFTSSPTSFLLLFLTPLPLWNPFYRFATSPPCLGYPHSFMILATSDFLTFLSFPSPSLSFPPLSMDTCSCLLHLLSWVISFLQSRSPHSSHLHDTSCIVSLLLNNIAPQLYSYFDFFQLVFALSITFCRAPSLSKSNSLVASHLDSSFSS